MHYGGARQSARVHAVNGVTLSVAPGEIVGLVGESGCGKSTLARMLVGIETATSGVVMLDGEPVVDREVWRELRRRVQYVFQDPYGALCPDHDDRRDADGRPCDQRRQATERSDARRQRACSSK